MNALDALNDYWRLGASLYVPATRGDLCEIAAGQKLGHVNSIIFCTEDSIRDDQVSVALDNLAVMLQVARREDVRMKFIRVRNPEVLGLLLGVQGIQNIDGFVLPKLTAGNLDAYLDCFTRAGFDGIPFYLMPTLETREVFDMAEMVVLRERLLRPRVKASVLCLRIGGNDLLNLLGVRRSRDRTLYETALGPTIAGLVTQFKPYGLNLSSPVCEFLYDHSVLRRELEQDTEYGIFAKTAIHPDQVAVIERAYQPNLQEVRMAHALLQPEAPAVFNMYGTMCEVATHREWAHSVSRRALRFGTGTALAA